MIACRLLKPGSKLRVERELGPSGRSTLAALLDIPNASADDLYEAMDWLAKRQPAISSPAPSPSTTSPPATSKAPAAHGYSRDHRSDRPQIVYGLLCNRDGCPVAVQAFAGNTPDPDTIADQVTALRERFGLARVTGDDFPGERLLVCFNPMVAAERRRQRDLLLELTEAEAARLAAGYAAGHYDRDEFNRLLGTLQRRRMGKHLRWEFDEATGAFISTRKQESIREEASLDGIYVIRTSLERAHLFVCMLAYYVEWHMRQRLAPLLFVEEGGPPAGPGPVGPVQRSGEAQRKDRTREGLPVQSFPDLLESLSSLTAVELELEGAPEHGVPMLSAMTPLQEQAFELLGISPHPAPALGAGSARTPQPSQ